MRPEICRRARNKSTFDTHIMCIMFVILVRTSYSQNWVVRTNFSLYTHRFIRGIGDREEKWVGRKKKQLYTHIEMTNCASELDRLNIVGIYGIFCAHYPIYALFWNCD